MRQVSWRHDRRQLFIPIAVMPSAASANASHSETVAALIDTGATKTGLRADLVQSLSLRKRDRAPVQTVNGTILADMHLARLGCWPANLDEDLAQKSVVDLPYIIDRKFLIQSLPADFPHQMLLGMDFIGLCDFRVHRSGVAELDVP